MLKQLLKLSYKKPQVIHFLTDSLRKSLVKKFKLTKQIGLYYISSGEEEDETDSNEVKIANDDSHIKFHSEPVENQNPVVVNSSNVVMLQTNPTVTTIDISKPCYLINSTPQQPIYSTGNVLSEQEIMSMPIVVCDDNKQEKTGLGQFIIPAGRFFVSYFIC